MTAKKLAGFAVVAAVLYAIFTDPTGAAGQARALGAWLASGAQAMGTFVDQLAAPGPLVTWDVPAPADPAPLADPAGAGPPAEPADPAWPGDPGVPSCAELREIAERMADGGQVSIDGCEG